MGSIELSAIVMICVFGGALIGLFLRTVLPGHHLSEESRDAVKLGAGLIATLTAMVLGLLISSAKTSFDSVNSALTQSGAKTILLDHTLGHYGPETWEIREQLRRSVMAGIEMFWPEQGLKAQGLSAFGKGARLEYVEDMIREMVPKSDAQKMLQAQALQLCDEQLRMRWLLLEQAQVAPPVALFVILVLWLTILFICFGLLAPKNGTIVVVFLICSLSVAAAMFLIQEMNTPLSGTMKISSAPLTIALAHIGKPA